MRRIGLLSDTHGYMDNRILDYLWQCDEIWHAGDIGTQEVIDRLGEMKPLVAVRGNVDGRDLRLQFPVMQRFLCEEVDVLMTHIGGYPDHYSAEVRKELRIKPPKLQISGHSHILKVIYDKKFNLLHINPGAAGIQGFHQIRTIVRFIIDGDTIRNLEAIELGRKFSTF